MIERRLSNMQYHNTIFTILSIISIILGLWLIIALIPSTISNIEQIIQKSHMIGLKLKLGKIRKLQQSYEYISKDEEYKAGINATIYSIEETISTLNKERINQSDVELSLSIQNSISTMIDYHVDSLVHNNYAINNSRYDIMKLDVDVKKISTRVFSSINPDIFKVNLIYTEEYLMTYIVEYTKTKLLSIIIPYNNEFSNY